MPLQLLFTEPIFFIVWILTIVYAITVHEFSHALAARLEGDGTAESLGRLTLNPLSHIDLLGFLMLVFIGFGWGKPVPFNAMYIKHRRWGPAFISLAGPISNILSVVIFGVILKVLVSWGQLDETNFLIIFLSLLIQINAILAIFNLIPLPPLDGSKLFFAFLPQTPQMIRVKLSLERYGPFILLGFILIDSFNSPSLLGSLFEWTSGILTRIFA